MENDSSAPPPASPLPPPIRARGRSRRRVLVELVIVTTGVLIALLLEGLVDWNRYRVLVREARATIAREIADNKRELEGVVATLEDRKQRLARAQRFADELIAMQKTEIGEINLGFEFPDLTAAAWQSAQQTGALGHMDYSEVQKYSKLYDLQALYTEHMRRSIETLAAAIAFFSLPTDPTSAAIDDVRAFRQQVLTLRAQLTIEEQLAQQLLTGYTEFTTR